MSSDLAASLAFYAMTFLVVGALLSGGLWALGAFSNNYTQTVCGKRGFLLCLSMAWATGVVHVLAQGPTIATLVVVAPLVIGLVAMIAFSAPIRRRRREPQQDRPSSVLPVRPSVKHRKAWVRDLKSVASPVLKVALNAVAVLLWYESHLPGALLVAGIAVQIAAVSVAAIVRVARRQKSRHVWTLVIVWQTLSKASRVLPRNDRAEWLSWTFGIFVGSTGLRRWRYLLDSLAKLPAAAWVARRLERKSATPTALSTCPEPEQTLQGRGPGSLAARRWALVGRSVATGVANTTIGGLAWVMRQGCRPMDWIASRYTRTCTTVVTVVVGAVIRLWADGGIGQTWQDLEQVGVLSGMTGAALYGWGRLRGIKMQGRDESTSSPE